MIETDIGSFSVMLPGVGALTDDACDKEELWYNIHVALVVLIIKCGNCIHLITFIPLLVLISFGE